MPVARGLLYTATVAALALCVRSLVVSPVPLAIALLAVLAYLLVIAAGVIFLRLGMFVDVVWRGGADARGVALTFDDGPSPTHTPRVLDLLDEHGVKATFFVIGKKAERHPELVREMVRRGHAVGLHSHAHDRLFAIRSLATMRRDLEREMDLLEDLCGERPYLFRPPIGHSSPRTAKVVDVLELVVVGWGVRAMDGTGPRDPGKLAERVRARLGDGVSVQLHDSAARDDFEPASVKALPAILDAMRDKDLEGVRVDAWLEHDQA
ncbi:MAG TPA: polysaccharide deacetylase family protein [Minicystis sp.]|nr:polysaccharide deacetylase family protein [Minicystis sp.]